MNKNKNIMFFSGLDIILYKLLSRFIQYGKVIIVTNAMEKWVHITSEILPNTKQLIDNNIDIISAKDVYQEKFPDEMYIWKKLIFKQITMEYFINKYNLL